MINPTQEEYFNLGGSCFLPTAGEGSPLHCFNKTQNNYFNSFKGRGAIGSIEEGEERVDSWSQYLTRAMQRRCSRNEFENTSLFASERRSSVNIPKCVRGMHIGNGENPYGNFTMVNNNKKKKSSIKSLISSKRRGYGEDEKVSKMYEMDKIQRKVSPSLLLDNYMQSS